MTKFYGKYELFALSNNGASETFICACDTITEAKANAKYHTLRFGETVTVYNEATKETEYVSEYK